MPLQPAWDDRGLVAAVVQDARDGSLLLTLRGHRDLVQQALFASDGRSIVSCSRDRTLRLWSAGPRR